MVDVSIIIVSYNTKEVTRRCIESIVKLTSGVEYEIIVVDNCSSDGSAEMIESDFPSVRLIRSPINAGFACGQNKGLIQSTGRYLLVLNSDIVLLNNGVRALSSRLNTGPEDLGVVGPQVLDPEGAVLPSARRALPSKSLIALAIVNRYFNFKRYLPERLMRKYFGSILCKFHDNYADHEMQKDADYIDGMCAMFKRAVLDKTGLFDEQFFFDFEIIDLSNRVRQHGWKHELFPDAKVCHLGGKSRSNSAGILIETQRSELIYFAKTLPEAVRFVRTIALCVLNAKLCMLLILRAVGKDRASVEKEIRVFREIIGVCKAFDWRLAATGAKIPVLGRE